MNQFMSLSEMRSIVCRMAYSAIRQYGVDQSSAMRSAWYAAKLIRAMRSGVVQFRYEKVSTGEIRKARGVMLSPRDSISSPAAQVRYFDIDKEHYRSFLIHKLTD